VDTSPQYCRVDTKTGKILDGPRTLPHNWGNVVGFHHLGPKDVARYGWFPVDIETRVGAPFGLLFLPERGIIAKVPQRGPVAGQAQYAIGLLRDMARRFAERDFASSVCGEPLFFSNHYLEQIHRLNCLETKQHCRCIARTPDKQHISVEIPYQDIYKLINDSMAAYEHVMDKMMVGLNDIANGSDREIAIAIDTGFIDYFDE